MLSCFLPFAASQQTIQACIWLCASSQLVQKARTRCHNRSRNTNTQRCVFRDSGEEGDRRGRWRGHVRENKRKDLGEGESGGWKLAKGLGNWEAGKAEEASVRRHMMDFAHSLASFALSSPWRADLFVRQTSGHAWETLTGVYVCEHVCVGQSIAKARTIWPTSLTRRSEQRVCVQC